MKKQNKTLHFNLRNIFILSVCSFFVIGFLWLLCSGLHKIGCPFPEIKGEKFSSLGFFSFSNFSFITFLAMIPFQTAEGQLSPGFYSRIINHPWSHFGLYMLLSCVITCFLILSNHDRLDPQMLNQLYMAIVGSVVFAAVFHLIQTLRYLYQPLIVYENLTQLANEESSEELWLDLYECILKAIKSNRIGNARNFIDLLQQVYVKVKAQEKIYMFQKDLRSLYDAAKEFPPITRALEKHWPLVMLENNKGVQQKQDASKNEPLVNTLDRMMI